MSRDILLAAGRLLMLAGLLIVGLGLVYALRVETQAPDQNPLPLELAAVAVGFMLFTLGRWCAAKGQGR